MSILGRLFPARADNRFDGHRASLWLLGLFVALKLVMSVNSILNTESVAAGADGIPLHGFGPAAAREILRRGDVDVKGAGTVDSKVRRLVGQYRQKYRD